MTGKTYDTPAAETKGDGTLVDLLRSLCKPATALVVLAVIAMFLDVALLTHVIRDDVPKILEDYGQNQAMLLIVANVGCNAIITLMHLVVLLGSIAMLRMKNYSLARSAAIAALIPFLSPVVLLGIPFGIWALALLGKPEVQAAFQGTVSQPNKLAVSHDENVTKVLPSVARPSLQCVFRVVLTIGCALAGVVGLTCLVASLAAVLETGMDTHWFLTNPRGRATFGLLVALAIGTVLLIDAARVLWQSVWRRGAVESVFGLVLIIGTIVYIANAGAR